MRNKKREKGQNNNNNNNNNNNYNNGMMVEIETFDALAQELEMLQAAYNSMKNDLEQEKKKCVRLQRLRAAAEDESASVRETLRHVQDELNEERNAAAIAEQEEEAIRLEQEERQQQQQQGGGMMMMGGRPVQILPEMNEHLHLQLRASEDARMAALLELQRVRAQLDYFRDSDADLKLRISQLEDQLNAIREAKRRTELHTLKVEEALEEQAIDLRSHKRHVDALKKKVSNIRESSQQEANHIFANLNMLTAQQAQGSGMSPRLALPPALSGPQIEVIPYKSPKHHKRSLFIDAYGQENGNDRVGYAHIHKNPQPPMKSPSMRVTKGKKNMTVGRRGHPGPPANVSPNKKGNYIPKSPTNHLQNNIKRHKKKNGISPPRRVGGGGGGYASKARRRR